MNVASALAEALALGERRKIDIAIERACTTGILKPYGDAWVSTGDSDEAWPPLSVSAFWRSAGFWPFHAKRYVASEYEAKILTAMSRVVSNVSALRAPPLWFGDAWVVSLYLPRSTNLANALYHGADTTRIIQYCLNSLSAFADHETQFQAAISGAGLKPPSAFPLTTRYNAACDRLKDFYDPEVLRDLSAQPPPTNTLGSATLFCDPKPANFIRPKSDNNPGIYRVDLDLMAFSAPLSLQAAIACFSVPSEPRAKSRQETFASRLRQWKAWCAAHATGPEGERFTLLLYHLVRNLASSLDQRNVRKAQAMADMLAQLIELEPYFHNLKLFQQSLLTKSSVHLMGIN